MTLSWTAVVAGSASIALRVPVDVWLKSQDSSQEASRKIKSQYPPVPDDSDNPQLFSSLGRNLDRFGIATSAFKFTNSSYG